MNTRTASIWRTVLAVCLGALACAGCVQGGMAGDSAAVPTGNVTAYGTIDEGVVIKR